MMMQNIMPESVYSFSNSKKNSKAAESNSKSTDNFSEIMNLNLNKSSNATQERMSNRIENRNEKQDNYFVNEVNTKKDTAIATNVSKIEESSNTYSTNNDNNSKIQGEISEIKTSLDQLQNKIKSTLDLSTEEFEQLLENLGFSVFDLLNPDNMKQFVLQANGSGDITSVLTDEKLAESMNQLLQMVNEINQDITVSKELVEELLAKESAVMNNNSNAELDNGINDTIIMVNKEENLINTNDITLFNNQVNNSDTADALVQNISSQSPVNQTNSLEDSNLKSNEQELIGTDKSLNQSTELTSDTITNTVSEDNLATTYTMSDENSNHNLSNQSNNGSETNLMNKEPFNLDLASEKDSDLNTQLDGYLNNLVNLRQNTTLNPEISGERINNFREIVNQIVEQLKIVINSEQTSMEMQLNPESLGKINLSLISKDGIMTAHFTTQNEVTKEAIESQMQILKDNLNSQGLKVESIEVTVSNFEFGQSSQAFANNNQRNNSQSRGFIQYDEDLESSKNEDSALLNDLMEQLGSSVSYTA